MLAGGVRPRPETTSSIFGQAESPLRAYPDGGSASARLEHKRGNLSAGASREEMKKGADHQPGTFYNRVTPNHVQATASFTLATTPTVAK